MLPNGLFFYQWSSSPLCYQACESLESLLEKTTDELNAAEAIAELEYAESFKHLLTYDMFDDIEVNPDSLSLRTHPFRKA